MKAVVKEGRRVALVEVPAPELRRPDDVIVEVICAGICRTDLQVADGTIASADPITLGHELCGRVIACGSAAGLPLGALVTVDPRIGDGFLGIAVHGAFAERVRVPAANVLRLPEIDPRRGAYVEPIAAALGVGLELGGRWVVPGDNRFSRLIEAVLAMENLASAVSDRLAPDAFDVGVETSGTLAEIDALVDAIRPGGVLVVRRRQSAAVSLPRRAVDKGVRVEVVGYGSFERAVELATRLELEPLFGASYPLARFEDAFAAATASEARKVFLSCAA